jgi:adenylate cyclase
VRARLAGEPTLDPRAHEAYVLGLQSENQRTREAAERAIEEFQRATSIDRNYAQAYAALARAYSLASVTHVLPEHDSMPEARDAALRAIALDDSLAGGHTILAFVKAHYEYDWAGARREYQRALELNPNDAYAHFFYSNSYLSPLGLHDEAIAEMQKAIEVDPFSAPVQSFLIRTYVWARRYEDGIKQFKKCDQMFPAFALNHERVAHLYTYIGKFDDAIAQETKARLLAGEDPKAALAKEEELRIAWKAGAAAGYWKKQLEFASMPENPPEAYVSSYGRAILYTRLGDKEQALASLEKAFADRNLAMTEMGVEPMFDPLRSDPRFTDLLRRVGLLQ